MKKILALLFLTLIVYVPLNAKDLYIKVMSVSRTDNLSNVKYKLYELGYSMQLTKHDTWYRIYTGPFKNKNEAAKALYKIKKHVSKDAFATYISISDDKITLNKVNTLPQVKVKKTPAQKNVVAYPKKAQTKATQPARAVRKNKSAKQQTKNTKRYYKTSSLKRNNKLFIGLTVGASKVDVKEKNINGDLPLGIILEDSGINYGIEAGYYFNKNIFMTLNYQQLNLDNLYFNNGFATINYQFNEMYSISPYIGIVGGMSRMTWEKHPLDSTSVNDTSNSYLGGVQVGAQVPIYTNISMYMFYRYLMMDYVSTVSTDTAEKNIEHNNEQNLNLGIKFSF